MRLGISGGTTTPNVLVFFGEGVGVDWAAGFQTRPQPARVSPPRINYPHIKTLVESDSFRPIQALDSSTCGVRGPPAHKNLDAREDQPYSSRPVHRIGRCILSPPTSTPRSPDKATRRFMGVSHFKEMVITAPLE